MRKRRLSNQMGRLTLILLSLLIIAFSYGQSNEKIYRSEKKEPDFSTAGEQEDYWTKRLFKFEYKRKTYKRFQGKISRIDSTTFKFDSVTVRHTDPDKRLILMLEKGILFPWMHGLNINMWEELTELNPSFKVKRFRLGVQMFNISNTTVYFIELTNKNATPNMDIMKFIEGANLTFLKQGWVLI
jgi:hypothetical protein